MGDTTKLGMELQKKIEEAESEDVCWKCMHFVTKELDTMFCEYKMDMTHPIKMCYKFELAKGKLPPKDMLKEMLKT
jgi:hypothetical protein